MELDTMSNQHADEYAEGEGKTREEAVANALSKLGLSPIARADTNVKILRQGVLGFFGGCKVTWRVGVSNLDAVHERKRREQREAQARQQSEKEKALLHAIRDGLLLRNPKAGFVGEDSLLSMLASLQDEADRSLYDFTYPLRFRLRHKTIAAARSAAQAACSAFGDEGMEAEEVLAKIKAAGKETREQIREIVVQSAMENEGDFDLDLLICVENHWVKELEAALRAADRFLDVVKLLLLAQKWEELYAWLDQHARYSECVLVLEKMKRFQEAVALMEKIGPAGYVQSFGDDGSPRAGSPYGYTVKIDQLKGYAKAAEGDVPKPVPTAEEAERAFALGEISEDEKKRLDEQRGAGKQAPCHSCGKQVQAGFRFCPFCGAEC